MQEFVGQICLDLTYYSGTDMYSDGPIEDELLDIVQNTVEEELNTVIEERESWPVLYHLSSQRHNIMENIMISKDQTVLEIGAGCGAITGKLAQKAKSVTCIELSKKRSLINAYRNRMYDNIEIKVGNFEDIHRHLTDKYDVITLIGVLEYAQSYIDSPTPFEDFIDMIKQHLTERGRIVIAIENKYGLKYWAGCREDHINTFFPGVEGYVNTNRARTFARNTLEGMLKQAGLEEITFYYPYPDYKFPRRIYSDDYLPARGELVENMCNYDNDRMFLFHEEQVYDNLLADGLFPQFSNSFLIVCSRKEKQ